jgi:hypothetical protein
MFKNRREIGIDFKNNTYKQASPGFSVQRGIKQQRRMLRFINNKVVIISS